jgi:hypothetical protein
MCTLACGSQVVVAFRGTESSQWKDLLTDAVLWPYSFDPKRDTQEGSAAIPNLMEVLKAPTAHWGFITGWRSVAPQILSLVHACTGGDRSWRVTMTGHSLGGALATISAHVFSQRPCAPTLANGMHARLIMTPLTARSSANMLNYAQSTL